MGIFWFGIKKDFRGNVRIVYDILLGVKVFVRKIEKIKFSLYLFVN